MLQSQQCTIVATAVEQPSAVQNSLNNDVTDLNNILCNCTILETIQNSKYFWRSSNVGMFAAADLALLPHTSSTTKNSSINQKQTLLMV